MRIEPQEAERLDRFGCDQPHVGAPASVGDEQVEGNGYAAGENLRGSNAVFGLIGTHASVDNMAPSRDQDGGPSDVDDIIGALYRQYCRVLDDPQASLTGDQFTQPMPVGDDRASLMRPAEASWKPRDPGESIETFLTGAQKVEHAFGPLGYGEAPGLAAMEPVPDILRLFAPAEYAAATRRRPPALPPALARREHHSLGIDSPLFAPRAIPLEEEST